MDDRLKFQALLEELLGNRHVYFQPPENLKMEYPAIKYSYSNIRTQYGNNIKYSNFTHYQVIVIDKDPNNEVIKKLLELPYSSYDRHYVSNNLNHDVISIYF